MQNGIRSIGIYQSSAKTWGDMITYAKRVLNAIERPIVIHFYKATESQIKELRLLYPSTKINIC